MMNRFVQSQIKTNITIDGYIHDLDIEIPQDIENKIHQQMIEYCWSQQISKANDNQFRDIVVLCMDKTNKELAHKLPVDLVRLRISLELNAMNGYQYTSMSMKEWCLMLKNNGICPIGRAAKLWSKIKSFDLTVIESNTPMYSPIICRNDSN